MQSLRPAVGARIPETGSRLPLTRSVGPSKGRQHRLQVSSCQHCVREQVLVTRKLQPPRPPARRLAAAAKRELETGSTPPVPAAPPSNGEQHIKRSVSHSQAGVGPGSGSEQQAAGTTQQPQQAKQDREQYNLGTQAALAVIRFYKAGISPLLQPACRYLPTCSSYAMQAYEDHGFWKGSVLTVWRLSRCAPWGGRGYDPVKWPPPGLEFIFRPNQ